jgi:organic hydroperoxide reductase OsmC/OhrA
MSHYSARILWQRGEQVFTDRRYSRAHRLQFDGGAQIPGSSSPQVVPLPYSDAAGVDPEEMFVASLSSCHMLWFLDLACRAGWCVDHYEDDAQGVMAKDAQGRLAMTQVTLQPAVAFGGERQPDAAEVARLHHAAHEACFIANSVRTDVRVLPRG